MDVVTAAWRCFSVMAQFSCCFLEKKKMNSFFSFFLFVICTKTAWIYARVRNKYLFHRRIFRERLNITLQRCSGCERWTLCTSFSTRVDDWRRHVPPADDLSSLNKLWFNLKCITKAAYILSKHSEEPITSSSGEWLCARSNIHSRFEVEHVNHLTCNCRWHSNWLSEWVTID